MNWQHIKAIYLSGLQMWLSDKKSIFVRLVVWPNAVPSLFVVFFLITVAAMGMRINASGGDMSSGGGVTFTVAGSDIKERIADMFSQSPTRFTYLAKDENRTIEQMIINKDITFGLVFSVDPENDHVLITLKYDLERDYPHKQWINQTKDKLAKIALEVRKKRLDVTSMTTEELKYALVPVDFKVEGFGANEDGMIILALTFIMWACLIMLPVDACASITSTQMLSDTQNDFLSVWKCAGVNPQDIMIGRLLTSTSVYLIGLGLLMTYIIFWVGLYCYLVGYLIPHIPAHQLENPQIYSLTVGFVALIKGVTLTQLLMSLGILTSVAVLMLCLRLRLSIYINNLEQVRTKLKGFDFVIFNMPFVGFIIGAATVSYATMSLPIFNGIVALSNMFKSDLTLSTVLVGIGMNLLLALIIFKFSIRHVDSQKRLLTCY